MPSRDGSWPGSAAAIVDPSNTAVLIAMVAGSGELHWTAAFLPVLLAVQLVLMCGIVWLTAAATVYLRDVRNVVGVALLLPDRIAQNAAEQADVLPQRQIGVLDRNRMGLRWSFALSH